jgi:hypothetical protein
MEAGCVRFDEMCLLSGLLSRPTVFTNSFYKCTEYRDINVFC